MKKKVVSIAIIAAMAASMAACGAPAEAPAADAAPAAPAETSAPAEVAEEAAAPAAEIGGKTIGYYKDFSDDYYKAGYEVFVAQQQANEATADWEIIDKVGGGTAQEQLQAVEDFITAGVDAIVVVQNSPEITAECIQKCNDAGIPYFALTHAPSVPEGGELAGFSGYDFVTCGVYAGEDAINYGVKKVVMIEGKLGQGTASAQSLGFLKAYEDAGLDIGGTAEDTAVNKTKGGADLEIVYWGSGGWMADPAKKEVANVITALGQDGFDGLYIQNDEMMDGGIQALEEAGLDPSNYWLGSSNGKEKSWKWVAEGKCTMDVNQTPSLEADLMYQVICLYFAGDSAYDTHKYVIPTVIPYNSDNVGDGSQLIPYDCDMYMERLANGVFNNNVLEIAGDATDLIFN